jgi:histidine decarboxylase
MVNLLQTKQKLAELKDRSVQYTDTFIGYPINLDYDYSVLFDFFNYSFNNVGDPFTDSLYKITTRDLEREVVQYFAKLYKLPADESWGYVTTGGTEGNLYGLFLGRELHPDARLYFSEDSHYSIAKAARLLRLPHAVVPSQDSGEVDYQALEAAVAAHPKSPVIVSLNIGTTMKGAIDNVDTVLAIFKRLGISDYYIHCDGALSGMMLPFLPGAPEVSFRQDIGSISISGHKFIGCPFPCGIVLTRRNFVRQIENSVEYVGINDTTIGGSRNGHNPLFLWYAIQTRKAVGFRKEARRCIEMAQYLYGRLLGLGHPCLLNPFSNTVVFKVPSDTVVSKWQLAKQDGWAHVITMQNISKEKLDEFVADLEQDILQPLVAAREQRLVELAER